MHIPPSRFINFTIYTKLMKFTALEKCALQYLYIACNMSVNMQVINAWVNAQSIVKSFALHSPKVYCHTLHYTVLDVPYSTKLWRDKTWRIWNCKKIGGENFGS